MAAGGAERAAILSDQRLVPTLRTLLAGQGLTLAGGLTFCGGHIWRNGVLNTVLVSYRIVDDGNLFSAGYRGAIHAAADGLYVYDTVQRLNDRGFGPLLP